MIKSTAKAVVLGSALTAFSLVHTWQGIDSAYRGFPFRFMNVIPGESYQNSAGQGTDLWCFLGYRPLMADWLIWTALALASLRFVKGTVSALFGVAAIYCVWGFLHWQRYHDYFGWTDWLIVGLSASIYLLLGLHARRSRLIASLIGVGLYVSLVAFQAFQSLDLLLSGLVFKVPMAILLFLAVLFTLRHQAPNQTVQATAAAPGS
jgi:hypothetical protein